MAVMTQIYLMPLLTLVITMSYCSLQFTVGKDKDIAGQRRCGGNSGEFLTSLEIWEDFTEEEPEFEGRGRDGGL